MEAAGAVLAAGAFMPVPAAGAAGIVAGAVEAAGAEAGADSLPLLLQAATPRARAAAERTTTYLFMIIHHQM